MLIGAAIIAFYFGSVFQSEPIIGIVGAIAGIDLQGILFLAFVIIGCLIIFIMLCGMCIAWKRTKIVQLPYILIISIVFLVFVAVGAVLVYVAGLMSDGLEEACNGGESDIAKVFKELYDTIDEFYCYSNSLIGCECSDLADGHVIVVDRVPGYDTSPSSDAKNAQDCVDYLEDAFDGYEIDFDSVKDIVGFLDYFGDIEQSYGCSGICSPKEVYYFSDISSGRPSGSCFDNIQNDLIGHAIEGSGIAFIITGVFIFVIWCIQYGLCCRRKQQGNPGSGESKKF